MRVKTGYKKFIVNAEKWIWNDATNKLGKEHYQKNKRLETLLKD